MSAAAQPVSTTISEIQAGIAFAAQVAGFFPGAGTAVAMIARLEPAGLALVQSVIGMMQSGKGPTAADIALLDQQIAADSATLHNNAVAAAAQLAKNGG
jgi:hypothetical protein